LDEAKVRVCGTGDTRHSSEQDRREKPPAGHREHLSLIGALLTLLNQGNGRGGMALQIDPGEDTALLRRALAGEWYYAVTRGGQVVRDLPAKPNHPWEDLGDAACYFAGGVAPQVERARRVQDDRARPPQFAKSSLTPWTTEGSR
jgi:hypothetical protein